MQNRISYYILSLLHLHGSVRIPGLGRIRQEGSSARRLDQRGQMTPPQTLCTFHAVQNDNGRLLEKYVAYKTQLSRTRARKEIMRFSQEVQSELRQDGKADLTYLGHLSLHREEVKFEPHPQLMNPGYAAYPVVTLPPRLHEEPAREDRFTEEPVAVTIPAPDAQPERVMKPDPESIPDIQPKEEPAESASVSSVSTHAVESQEYPLGAPPELQPVVMTREVKRPPESAPAQRETSVRWFVPVAAILLAGLILAAFLLMRERDDRTLSDTGAGDENIETGIGQTGNEQPQESDTRIVLADTGTRHDDTSPSEDSAVGAESLTPETPVESPSTPPLQDTGDLIQPAGTECLIVVGAFSLTINADRMVRELQEMGHPVEMRQHGRLAQVGVPVDCSSDHLGQLMNDLRTQVDPGAWLLRPE